MKDNMEMDLEEDEYDVTSEHFNFEFGKGKLRIVAGSRRWIIPLTEFSSEDIAHIREIIESKKKKMVPTHLCGGCYKLPAKGFASHKFQWCSFSRKIAKVQDEYNYERIDDSHGKDM